MVRKIFFLFLFFPFHQVYCQVDCELKKSQDSIFVYTCKSIDSRLKSIKAEFVIKTKLSVLTAHLLDVANFTHWQYNTIASTVIKKTSLNELVYRSEIEAPWPVSNRDLVMHLKITQNPFTKVMTMELKSMSDLIPEKKDVVRIPRAEGKWVVEPIGENELRIHYTFIVDPGGSVPVWLINLALAEGPYETFRNLKARINSGEKIIPASFISD